MLDGIRNMEEPMESRGVLGRRQVKFAVFALVLSIIALGVSQSTRAQTLVRRSIPGDRLG